MNLIRKIAVFAATFAACALAWASPASRAEAQSQVAAAVAHVKKVGVEQGAKDINSAPEWKVKSMNVNFVDLKGVVLASSLNERLVGRNTLDAKDPSGKEYVKEFIAAAQRGEGWIDYQFINPETKKLEERSMFVRRVPGFDGFVGVAISK